MSTIKLQNNKVILQNNNVSCDCCCTDLKEFSENHGFDECPNVAGEPCFSPGTPSCAGLTVTGELISKTFPNSCRNGKTPKADVSATFDDFGYIGSLSCDDTANCNSCGVQGTIDPEVEDVGTTHFKLKIPYQSRNAYWGGPYGINCSAKFYFI